MGGEFSKHSNSSALVHRRGVKRSSRHGAPLGRDCDSNTVRRAGFGPPVGEIPDTIPSSPVLCVASPISPKKGLSSSASWIFDTEAVIIADWNRDIQGVVSSSPLDTARPRARAVAVSPDLKPPARTPEGNASSVVSLPAGSASPCTLPPLTESSSLPHPQTCSGLPVTCESVSVTTGRSTGMSSYASATCSSPESSHKKNSQMRGLATQRCKAPSHPKISSVDGMSSVIISALPVGIDYFRALQSRWLAPADPSLSLPPATDEDDLDDTVILSAVAETHGDVFSPPVPLRYMIDLFVPHWDSEGLFDAAQISRP